MYKEEYDEDCHADCYDRKSCCVCDQLVVLPNGNKIPAREAWQCTECKRWYELDTGNRNIIDGEFYCSACVE